MYLYLACWRVTTGKSEEVGYGEGGRKAFFAALAPVGRLLGYRDHYPKYGGAEAPGAAGPPPTARVMVRGVAVAASLLAASSFLLGWVRLQA